MNKRAVGEAHEKRAGLYLESHGYRIVEYNFRCRSGEIDIIARDGRYLVFVEVKYRRDTASGNPLEAVGKRKQQAISRTAAYYCFTHGYGEETPCRFDVAAVLGEEVTLLKNAFEYGICGRRSMIAKNDETILREEYCHTKDGANVLLLKYPLLEETGLVKHCFTTRIGGVSSGIYAAMNVSFNRGDARENVETNYRRLSEALGVSYGDFVFTDQTHTANVRKVTGADRGKGLTKERDYHDVDGLVTNEPGIVLSAFFADCVPLYFVDPVHRAIGLSHSGWRGTVSRIGKATIAAMEREYGTAPADLICAVGPSICQDCYEVGEDVAEAFREAFGGAEREILKKSAPVAGEMKYRLNLWKANERVLLDAGVKKEHIAVTNICTCCNHKVLFSHRASCGKRGNLGAFLCMK